MGIYRKTVSICAAAALLLPLLPVIPVNHASAAEPASGYTRYEAERQHTGGWADVAANSGASGGYVVERIGGTETDIGTVVFKIWAEEQGTYNAELGYISKNASDFFVRVNYYAWDTGNDAKFTTTASSGIQKQAMQLDLNAGWNDVKIYSTKGVDNRIAVDYLDVDAEGYTLPDIIEHTAATKNNVSERDIYKAADGRGITGLGQNGSADFTVNAVEAGTYDLGIWYSSADYRALEIYVDDVLFDTVYCPVTNETDRVDTSAVKLELSAGDHKITFKNQYGQAPDIDKIQFTKAADETANVKLYSINMEPPFTNGIFSIDYDLNTGKADYRYGDDVRVKGFESVVKVEDFYDSGDGNMINTVVKSSDYTNRYVTYDTLNDAFGQGDLYTVVNEAENLPAMYQKFYVYENMPYALVQVELGSDKEISTNFMAPISASGNDVVNIGNKSDARALFVPFSNDNYVAYNPETLGGAHTSYFVTAIFDNNTRNSVITGSIDHDTWKTGTSVWATSDNGSINFLGAFGGIESKEFTYDFQPHGSVSGQTVSSPKMFLGYFDDWRDGMDAYGDANKRNNGKLSWGGGSIFGFNSWNAHGSNVTLDNMKTAADEMKTLHDNGFCDENGVTWVNVDSYFDNMINWSAEDQYKELKEYVNYAHDKGLKVGLYNARHVTWDNNLQGWGVRNSAITDEYGNPVALAKPNSTYGVTADAMPIDPTSDHFKNDVKEFMTTYQNMGFDYLKIDFMNYCAVEGHYSDKNVTTGMQAYNALCKEFTKYIDPDKFFINYSIAPLFPSQYAHSRRISCDIGTEGGTINSANMDKAKYMMNALQYGWWQDGNLYEHTDPDQISFYKGLTSFDNDAARGKYTSGVIAGGVMLLSNDFSVDRVKTGVEKVAGNERVNEVARIGKAFRPTKATNAWSTPYESNKQDPDNVFYMEDNGYTYVAVFNFDSSAKTKNFNLADVGLDPSKSYPYTELWDNSAGTVNAGNTFTTNSIQARSANLYKIASGADTQEDNVLLYEDFDTTGTTADTINGGQQGWQFGTYDDNTEPYVTLESKGSGNSMKLSAGNNCYYKSGYVNLSLKANGAAKNNITEDEMLAKLSDDIAVSFKVNYSISDVNEAGPATIRLKDKNGNNIVELQTPWRDNKKDNITNKLNLINVDGHSYTLKDPIDNSDGNNEWQDITVNFDMKNSKFRVAVDGNVFVSPDYGEWLPSGTSLVDNAITDLHMEIYRGSWYQHMYVDNIKVVSAPKSDIEFVVNADIKTTASGRDEIYPGDTIDYTIESTGGTLDESNTVVDLAYRPAGQGGYQPMTGNVVPDDAERVMLLVSAQSIDGKKARKTVYADVEPFDRAYFTENFDSNSVYEDIQNSKNGWKLYGGAKLLADKNAAIQKINGMLRFVSMNYWDQIWLDKDIMGEVKGKYTADGWSDTVAQTRASADLKGDLAISFKAGFQYDDLDTGNTNQAHIRLRGADGHTFAEIYNELPSGSTTNTIYLRALNSEKTQNKLYQIETINEKNMSYHDFRFIINEAGNAYKLYIDGNQFTGTDFNADWIPASSNDGGGNASQMSIGGFAKLTLGEYWTTWYQTIWFDDLKVEPVMYDIETSEFVGGTIRTVRSRHDTSTAQAGNRVFVTVTPNEGYTGTFVTPLKMNGTEITDGMFIMPRETANITGALKEAPKKLAAPVNLKFANGTASWTAVNNASGYSVQLYKGENKFGDAKSVTETSYKFDISEIGDYTFTVKALGGGDDKFSDSDDSAKSPVYKYTVKLSAPTGLTFNNGEASWTPVDNANGYSVQLYKNGAIEGTAVEITSGTSYNFNISVVGDYNFTVKALGNTYYTESDEAENETHYIYRVKLNAPANLKFENGRASWTASENASTYTIQLYKGNEAIGDAITNITGTSYTFTNITDVGDYTFTIRANTTGFYNESDMATSTQYIHSKQLEKPSNVQFTNSKVTWNAVNNASKYSVQLYNSENKTVGAAVEVTGNTEYTFDFGGKSVGSYTARVTAIGDGTYYKDSIETESNEYEYMIKLEKPSELAFENGTASWAAVDHADKYSVQLYDKDGHVVGDASVVTGTSHDFQITTAGTYTFKVTALSDNKYYTQSDEETVSEPYKYTINLSDPSDVKFDADGKATWGAVDGANAYRVQLFVKGESSDTPVGDVQTVQTTTLSFTYPDNGTYYYTVQTVGDEYHIAGEAVKSEEYEYTKPISAEQLEAPQDLKFDIDTCEASWSKAENTSKYEVRIYRKGSDEQGDTLLSAISLDADTTTYTFDNIKLLGTYYYTVQAIGDGTNFLNSEAAKSEEKEYTPVAENLAEPENVSFENGVASWSKVENAKGYSVQLYKNDESVGTAITTTALSYTFNTKAVGKYKFTVTAVGDGIYYNSSNAVESNEITSYENLGTPLGLTFIDGTASWTVVASASSYKVQLYKGGEAVGAAQIVENATNYTFTFNEVGRYTFTVQAIGDGTLYLDGAVSASSSEYEYKMKLAAPSGLTFENGIAAWSGVDNASSYSIQLFKDGTASGEPVTVSGTSYDFQISEVGNYTFKVKAVSVNEFYIDSDEAESSSYSHKVTLNAPANLNLDADGNATWTAVDGAGGYRVQLYRDGAASGSAVNVNLGTAYKFTFNNAGTYTFKVKALGNGNYSDSPEAESKPYKHTIKLETPKDLTFENGMASWTASENASGYKLQLYKNGEANGSEINVGADVNSYTFSITETGIYTYSIQAVGDGTNYKDSEAATSDSYTPSVTLAKPSNLTFENGVAAWSAVENASGYSLQLYKNGEASGNRIEVSSDTLSYTFAISRIGTYTYSVKAVGDGTNYKDGEAETSDRYIYSVTLTKPSNLTFENGVAAWSAAENASGYSIQLYKNGAANGSEITVGADVNSYTFSITETGLYTYKIKAIGDNLYYMDSELASSGGYRYTQTAQSEKLSAPSNLKFDDGIATWTAAAHAQKYTLNLYKDDALVKTVDTQMTTYNFNINESGSYYYTVQAIGDGTSYTDSDETKSAIYNHIEILEGVVVETPKFSGNTVIVSASNYTQEDAEIDVYVAEYNAEHVLVKVYKANTSVVNAGAKKETITVNGISLDEETKSAKVFVWDSNMKPYIGATSIK